MKLCFPWNTFIYVLNFVVRIGCCFIDQPCSENDVPLFQINTTELISYMIVKSFSNVGCYLVVLNTYVLSYLVKYYFLNFNLISKQSYCCKYWLFFGVPILNKFSIYLSFLIFITFIFKKMSLISCFTLSYYSKHW